MPVATLEINYDMPPGTSNKYKHIHTPSQRQAHIQRVSSHVWPSANTLLCTLTLHTHILKIDKYKCILTIVHHSHKSQLTLNTTPVQFIKHQSCTRFDRYFFYSYTLWIWSNCRVGLLLDCIHVLLWDMGNQCTLHWWTPLNLKSARADLPHVHAPLFRITSWCREHVSTLASC